MDICTSRNSIFAARFRSDRNARKSCCYDYQNPNAGLYAMGISGFIAAGMLLVTISMGMGKI